MEIKPCPFCGNSNGLRVSGSTFYCVVCDNCDTFGPTMGTKEKAIELWNAAPRKEDTKMEKNCRSCKYLKLGNKAKSKWYCTKALEDEYSSCKSWAPYNPFKPTQMTVCDECQYEYFDNGEHYCGKAIWNLDYSCPGWEAKEPEPAPLKSKDLSGLDVIGEIVTRTLFPSNVRQLIEEAAELIVACNKYIRATGNGQPTPVSEDEALAMIAEELADVHIVGEVLMRENSGMEMFYHDAVNRKPLRWKRRLDGEEQDHTEPGD